MCLRDFVRVTLDAGGEEHGREHATRSRWVTRQGIRACLGRRTFELARDLLRLPYNRSRKPDTVGRGDMAVAA